MRLTEILRRQLSRLKEAILKKSAIRSNVEVGKNFHAGPGSVLWAPAELKVGHNVYVGKHVTVEVDGTIGDEVLIANGVGLVGRLDHDFNQRGTAVRSANWVGRNLKQSRPLTIGSDVWIGYNSVVLSGLTVANSVVIAAGSVVTKDIRENCIVAGNPARVIRDRYSAVDFEEHWRELSKNGTRRIEVKSELRYRPNA